MNQTLEITLQALAEKDEMIAWWTKKARALSRKYQACLFCQSNQDFLPELLECKACQAKDKAFWKGISLKKEVQSA